MATGSVQTIITCVAKGVGPSVSPCVDVAGSFTQPQLTQAYVIDAGQSTFVDGLLEPLDYASAGAVWAFAFTTVVGLYLLTSSLGHILRLVRG